MPIKLVMFDFDQTLASIHVYYLLSEGVGGCETDEEFTKEQLKVWRDRYGKEKDLDMVYGGTERRTKLAEFLQNLRDKGVILVIVSHGLTNVVAEVVEKGGLGKFDEILGCDAPVSVGCHCVKSAIAKKISEKYKIPRQECLLVDDDVRNLSDATAVLPTLWVWEREGLTPDHFTRILHAVDESKERNGWYSEGKILPLTQTQARAGGEYLIIKDALDLTSAINRCNSSPSHMRLEPLKIFRTTRKGAASYSLLYPSVSYLVEFARMAKIPNFPTCVAYTGSPAPCDFVKRVKAMKHGCFIEASGEIVPNLTAVLQGDSGIKMTNTCFGTIVREDGEVVQTFHTFAEKK
eukprot:TRINITY_DN8808_c1_g1_i1.p1 TRINITY_DN8808_c1_g1~~TRINITY_DN8808_c1_g1_i1.p1  ORF type:complete len:349 (+),score=37.60 TRINITY_DN8808_c1_g1_i1:65-1111(+)